MTAFVRLEGYALHRGVPTAVTLTRKGDELAFERNGQRVPLARLAVKRSDLGVLVTDGDGFELDLVEHLLAAFGGLGVDAGVTAILEGPEVPILDGGARRFADALIALDVVHERAPRYPLAVTRAAELRDGDSTYIFAPGEAPSLAVEAVFDHPSIGTQRASWDGSRETFLSAIATARTFGFRSDLDALAVRGRAGLALCEDAAARRAFAEAVIVFDAKGPALLESSRPVSKDEIARHKLLDLIGDFALYGGPPAGHVAAHRPGHTASHRIIAEALSLGILSPR
ncbi:MAG: UDP-3-O-acyl-N-acetylglucosamine deacetylase [Polyangiaceae bacterium]